VPSGRESDGGSAEKQEDTFIRALTTLPCESDPKAWLSTGERWDFRDKYFSLILLNPHTILHEFPCGYILGISFVKVGGA
jgi:hypothetical protein